MLPVIPITTKNLFKSQSDDKLKKHLIIAGRFVRSERAILVPQEHRTLLNFQAYRQTA
jgi:hypothetical protein